MELRPLQTEWIKSLRAHPERQSKVSLGNALNGHSLPEAIKLGEYKACCLGELHIIGQKYFGCDISDKENKITDYEKNPENINHPRSSLYYLYFSYKDYGLINEEGLFSAPVLRETKIQSLAMANDLGWSWTDIADYVEQHPENVFTKSV